MDNVVETVEVVEVVEDTQLPTEVQAFETVVPRTEVKKEVLSLMEMDALSEKFSRSTIVPIAYQNRPENCLIAIDLASRMNMSVMTVMQNLHIIQGKPSFSGTATSAMIRSSAQFTDVRLNYVGTPNTDSWGAYVSAIRKSNGQELKGSTVTIATAKEEGWYQKNGSKWKTMPEQMLGYRAYAWFGRLYAPELMMGLHSVEELEDIGQVGGEVTKPLNPYNAVT